MSPLIFLDPLRFSLSLIMFIYASWRDVKTREIPDLLWIFVATSAFGLDIYEIYAGELTIIQLILAIIFSFAISFPLAYFGLFGGADFKAFMVLSFLQPTQPRFVNPLLNVVSSIYPLTIFANSAVAGACMAVIMLLKNIALAFANKGLFERDLNAPLSKKLLVMISGTKMNVDKVRGPPFEYPLEKIEGKERRLMVTPKILKDEDAVKVIEEFREAGVKEIWMSRTLPFIVFITIGFILSIFLGDIVLSIVELILNLR